MSSSRGAIMPIEKVSAGLDDLDFRDDIDIRDDQLRDLENQISRVRLETSPGLASYVPDADDFQSSVINAGGPVIRVLAPAGSGKSQTMVNRVISRIKNGARPERMLLLTFDNAASQSLKQCVSKIQNKHDIDGIEGAHITTLNAFGFGVLRQYVPKEYKPVVKARRRSWFVKEILDELKKKSPERFSSIPRSLKRSFFLDFFSVLKNDLFDPRNINGQELADYIIESPQAKPFLLGNTLIREDLKRTIQAIIWLYTAYEIVLQRERLLDFDDQKLRAYISLIQDDSLLKILQNSYSEIIVDEFQDINKLDFNFIDLISKKSSLVVTGDDDQAIYGFRGCSPDYIIDLENHLRRKVISYELKNNYRCPANIVGHANRLIRNNKRRIEKSPIAINKDDSAIKVVSSLTAGIESRLISSIIKKVRKANAAIKYNDIVVLYRTNAQSLPLQIEFILNEIPYYVREEDNILNNEELEKLLGVIRLKIALEAGKIPSVQDKVYTVESYFRFIGEREKSRLVSLFNKGREFTEDIQSDDFYGILPKAEVSKFPEAFKEVMRTRSLMTCLEILSKRFKGLEGMIGSLEDVIDQEVPLGEIFEIATAFKGNMSDFVVTLQRALNTARDTSAGKDEEGGVKLLTYFKSKGLQWHTVILTSCNEGLIPHKRAHIEDERRLFYVALTRVQKNLFISYVKRSCQNKVSPSRFLYEAGLLAK